MAYHSFGALGKERNMSYPDSYNLETTMDTFFDRNVAHAGGDTSQLGKACSFLQELIAQDLCETSLEELWIYFPVILTRIFGKQDAVNSNGVGSSAVSGLGRVSGGEGGVMESSWMFSATSFFSFTDKLNDHPPWETTSQVKGRGLGSEGGGTSAGRPGRATSDQRVCCMRPSAVSLLKLLVARAIKQGNASSPIKTLFDVLLETREVFFGFPCSSPPMPLHTLAFLRGDPRLNATLFLNSRLYTHCLASPPSMIAIGFRDSPLGRRGTTDPSASAANPSLRLSPLEYYLFCFARYALSSSGDFYAGIGGPGQLGTKPDRRRLHHTGSSLDEGTNFRTERVALGWRKYGVKGLIHINPYMTLLKDYMEAFFPHRRSSVRGSKTTMLWHGGSSGDWSVGMDRRCELFLRVIAEFWLEANTILRPGVLKQDDQAALQYQHNQQQQQQQQQSPWGNNNATNSRRPDDPFGPSATTLTPRITDEYDPSAALLMVSSDFAPPPDMVLHGLLLVSTHLLADPKLPEALSCLYGGHWSGETLVTPGIEVLRPHVFSFLRLVFSSAVEGVMHTGSVGFSLAVELWLLWMCPWVAEGILNGSSSRLASMNSGGNNNNNKTTSSSNGGAFLKRAVTAVSSLGRIESPGASANADSANSRGGVGVPSRGRARGGGSYPGGVKGRYGHDPWEGWVLENYSLYTSIFVAFARRASKMPFKVYDSASGVSAGVVPLRAKGKKNLELLSRVTGVFNDQEMSLLFAVAQNSVRQAQGGDDVTGLTLNETQQRVLEKGRKAFAPIQGPRLVALSEYKSVAENLLGSIGDLTYPRPPHDWSSNMALKVGWGAKLDSAQTQARTISVRMKKLFGIPSSWRPRGHREHEDVPRVRTSLEDIFRPDRDKDAPAFLTREGQAQLASGRKVCKPWDVRYVGDPLYYPLRDWETKWSVQFWVGLSEKINTDWLGWPAEIDGDDVQGSPVFEDEGPSRMISQGREFQRRVWNKGKWVGLPRRLNLRPLADLRAMLGMAVAMFLLRLAFRVGATVALSFAMVLGALCLRLSVMADSLD